MAGLFNILLNKIQIEDKIPLEDFFTKIFAFILNNYEELFKNWLQKFEISNKEDPIQNSVVQTQRTFTALKEKEMGHDTDSRPDIYIEIKYKNGKSDIVFIESKIGSSEGEKQLPRYAEHLNHILNNDPDISQGILVFITKDYEEKDKAVIFEKCDNRKNLDLIPLRWYEVFGFLESYKENNVFIKEKDIFIRETLRFMKEKNMSLNNQFSPVDILTLTNFPSVNKMMDETMFGKVSEKFEEITGHMSRSATALTQLRNYRYIYYSEPVIGGMWCGCGYFFNPDDITCYPEVGIILAISYNLNERNKIIKDIRDKTAWKVKDIESWTELYYTKSLREFLPYKDHIKVIKEYFVESLQELKKIKEEYPELPWNK